MSVLETINSNRYPPISDYGLISDMRSSALVSSEGSIDWCCLPKFDSASIFGRLLDWDRGGHFKLAPVGNFTVNRRYIPRTNVLETTFKTNSGVSKLTDFMPVYGNHFNASVPNGSDGNPRLIRTLECIGGTTQFLMECNPRFYYGDIVPRPILTNEHFGMIKGENYQVSLACSAPMSEWDNGLRAEGRLDTFGKIHVLLYFDEQPEPNKPKFFSFDDLEVTLNKTIDSWNMWASTGTYNGMYQDAVERSALTLKALTYQPGGGFVAAPTTSLPEAIGGVRNWDYRYTWIRDASFGVSSLSLLGYLEESKAFATWLAKSTNGSANDLQVMYGLQWERQLTEVELPNLHGYHNSKPVRIGNAAYSQVQLDIYGEILDAARIYSQKGGEISQCYWEFLISVADYVSLNWKNPDDGIWETRGSRAHFVFSKVWCWVAIDRAIKTASYLQDNRHIDKWKRTRWEIKKDILDKGFNAEKGAFVQSYGSNLLDASLLTMPLVGFISPRDPRSISTIRAIQKELTSTQGFVYRYKGYDDGIEGSEGAFIICTFWLVDNLILLGEVEKARGLYEKLMNCSNDLGLLSEQLDPETGNLLGNFPQTFSHAGIINTSYLLNQHNFDAKYPTISS